MAQSNSKLASDAEEKEPLDRWVFVTDDMRKLANEIAVAFDKLVSGTVRQDKLLFEVLPNSASIKTLARLRAVIVIAKIPDTSKEIALHHLSEFGTRKNKKFPSSLEDHFYRCRQADAISHVREKCVSLSSVSDKVFATSEPNFARLRTIRELALNFGPDPLADLTILVGESDPKSEILLFLEQYLSYDLVEICRNLADTGRIDCPIPSKEFALLSDFNQ